MDRQQLRKKIPQGYCKVLAERAGVSNVSVSKFFKGTNNSRKIEMVALKLALELKQEKEELVRQVA